MGSLDLRTIVITGALTDVICSAVIIALWRQNRDRFAGLGHWSVNFIFQSAGLLLIVLRGAIPDWMSMTLANALIVSGAVIGLIGLEKFFDRTGSQTHNYLLVALAVAFHAYFTFVRPSFPMRVFVLTMALFAVCGQCMWLLLRRVAAPLRRQARWPGIIFAVYSLVFAAGAARHLIRPPAGIDYFQSGEAEAVPLITILMLFILMTHSLALTVSGRLHRDLMTQEQKFSKAFHSSPSAILITRLSDNRVFEVNDSFLRITGYPLHEVLGHSILDLHFWAHLEERGVIIDHLLQGVRIQGYELEFTRKSGELFTGLYSAELVTINGEGCILSSIRDISDRKLAELERERLVSEREKALSEVKVLSGLLPICASCKKIRDDRGYWNQIESYIERHSAAEFSHGICPDCKRKLYPEFADDGENSGAGDS